MLCVRWLGGTGRDRDRLREKEVGAASSKNCDAHGLVAECSVAGGPLVWRVPQGLLGAVVPRAVVDRRLGPRRRGGGGMSTHKQWVSRDLHVCA